MKMSHDTHFCAIKLVGDDMTRNIMPSMKQ